MLNRTIAKFIFYGVALVLLTWTASLTVSFLRSALPNTFWLVPFLGLVVFDGGMIAWLFVFISHAEGAIQRSVALCLTVFDLLGVGLMVMAEILLDGQQLVNAPDLLATAAIWGIGVWTIVNVAGLVLFHLGDPQARKEMAIQSEKDAIWEGALDALKNRRVQDQQRLAGELSDVMFRQMLAELRADDDRDGIPDLLQRGAQSARQAPYAPVADLTLDDIRSAPIAQPAPVQPNGTARRDPGNA